MKLVALVSLATLAAFAAFASGCSSSADGANGTGGSTTEAPAFPGDTGELAAADPSLNQALFTTKDEEILTIDPGGNGHTTVFRFDDYVDISSLQVVGETLFVGAGDNSINAIDLGTKKLRWDFPLGRYENTALADPSVTVADGVVYAAGVPGVLFAVDAKTGKERWSVPLAPSGDRDGYYSSVGRAYVAGDRLYIGTTSSFDQNYLHALDPKTGKRIFRKEITGLSGRPKLVGDLLLVPMGDLVALDPASGEERWRLAMEPLSRGAGTPVVSGGYAFVQGATGVAEGKLFCVDLATGTARWQIDAGNDYAGVYTPTVIGNVVFGVYERGSSMSTTGNGRPFAVAADSGATYWENDRVSVDTSPVLANGRLFFQGQNFDGTGDIDLRVGTFALDASSGAFLWLDNYVRYSSSLAPMVVASNGVFTVGAGE